METMMDVLNKEELMTLKEKHDIRRLVECHMGVLGLPKQESERFAFWLADVSSALHALLWRHSLIVDCWKSVNLILIRVFIYHSLRVNQVVFFSATNGLGNRSSISYVIINPSYDQTLEIGDIM